jgi:hypothetical protein
VVGTPQLRREGQVSRYCGNGSVFTAMGGTPAYPLKRGAAYCILHPNLSDGSVFADILHPNLSDGSVFATAKEVHDKKIHPH